MTSATLIVRSLSFHARSHLGALLGAAVGSAVLVGALLVGDSVRGSLRDMALARLGSIDLALASNDRFFRDELADEISRSAKIPTAPAIQLQGIAALSDGSARANRVQVLGIDQRFWTFALQPASFPSPAPGEVIVNRPLAEQLRVKPGDTILLRVENGSGLSREAPLSPQDDAALALRVTVRGVAPDNQMGRFSLQANQVAPFTAFVSESWLGDKIKQPRRANLLLAGSGALATDQSLAAALRQSLQLADAEVELREVPTGLELRTRRVFLDPAITSAALAASTNATGVLTYFVNELRAGPRATPYSMVTAIGAPIVPPQMRDGEILVNQWLADDLQAKPGDRLSLTYFTVGGANRLAQRTNQFTVRAVLPMTGPAADRTFMPEFPGIERAESTRDWDSSLPIKLDRIRPKDEEYWKKYRGTPKAFVTLAAGQDMWANRFGNLTAVRYPPGSASNQISAAILENLDPGAVGLNFQPVRQLALAASSQGQDFGQLFLGFSFFLIVAALLLMALLFQFSIERRATEVGTLLALGFTPKQVRRLLLGEGAILALIGTLAGVPGGVAYARAMLYGLSTIWRSAVGTSTLAYHSSSATLAAGALSALLVAVFTIWLALRKQARLPARELLSEGAEAGLRPAVPSKRRPALWIGWASSALAMLLLGWAGMQRQSANPEIFFMAGALLLISGLGFAAAILSALAAADTAAQPSLPGLSLRNATRRRRRSLATIGLLACGSFLVAAIGAFKLDANTDASERSSGTGGFALIGESALPIVQDLNTESGREFFGLSSNDLPNVQFVSFRVHDGEDASCLNLNRAQKPRLLGVRPELLDQRHAFTFAQVASGSASKDPWLLLKQPQPDGSIPAIGDAASIQWALGKSVGDTLSYTDERGRAFKLRLVAALANSILQGSLIIDEKQLMARFPSATGYRMFLIDAPSQPPKGLDSLSATLARATQDYGLELIPATRRLAEFNAVQNTYLNTFQVLGGLGLLLGSVGLGVVVLRNVLERRGEFGLLLALGFRARALKWLVLDEHGALLVAGLIIGIVAALVAVLPSLLAPGSKFPISSLALTLGGILLSGVVWTWLATLVSLRGKLLDSLRNGE